MKKLFTDVFFENAAKNPEKPAIIQDGKSLTYGTIREMALCIGAKLAANGVRRGDSVAIELPRCKEYIAAMLGVWCIGAVCAVLDRDDPPNRLKYIEKDCDAIAVIDEAFMQNLEAVMPLNSSANTNPDEPALLIYTSCSMGSPIGILHTQGSIASAMMRHFLANLIDSYDVCAMSANFSSAMLIIEVLMPLYAGARVVIIPDDIRKDVKRLAAFLDECGATSTFIAPKMLRKFKPVGSSLHRIMTGGERVTNIKPIDSIEIYNLYGMTETCLMTNCFLIDRQYNEVPIGRPAPGIKAYFLKDGNYSVKGEGELCLTGDFFKEYMNLPDLTAQTRISNPFSKDDGNQWMVKTGDICLSLEDGNIVYLGRRDRMAKIDGQRVEPDEIEKVLTVIPTVKECAVKIFENDSGKPYICAYYTQFSESTEQEIRSELLKNLPLYMIPTFFICMDSLPTASNGNIDYDALKEPDTALFKSTYNAPTNETEAAICRGFENVFGLEQVGIDDDFIALGGDFSKSIELMRECSELPLTSAMIMRGRTPSEIAESISNSAIKKDEPFLEKASSAALTGNRLFVYLDCIRNPQSTMYNNPYYCKLDGQKIDCDRLVDAIKKVFAHFEAFHLCVDEVNGAPSFILQDNTDTDIPVISAEAEDIEQCFTDFVRPFDLSRSPLSRIQLIKTESSLFIAADFHRILFDECSVKVLCRALKSAYENRPIDDEHITPLCACIAEQKEIEHSDKKSLDFFTEKICKNNNYRPLPIDKTNEACGSVGGRVSISLPFSCENAQTFARGCGVTESTLFTAAFSYALAKMTFADQSAFYIIDGIRHDIRLDNSVGMFSRAIPFCFKFNENGDVGDCLKDVQEYLISAAEQDDVPLNELIEKSAFQPNITFLYRAEPTAVIKLNGISARVKSIKTPEINTNLSVTVTNCKDRYEIRADYRKCMYNESTIHRLIRFVGQITAEFINCKTLNELTLQSAEDRTLIENFNATQRNTKDYKSILSMFNLQVERAAQNTAAICEDTAITYGELDDISNRIAAHLQNSGIGRGDIVSLLVPRGICMLTAAVGILKSGAAYMPLNCESSPNRLEYALKDSRAKMMIADRELIKLLPDYNGRVLYTDEISSLEQNEYRFVTEASDAFTVIYDFGKSDKPNGITLCHGNLVNFCRWYQRTMKLDETAKAAALSSFDAVTAVADIYPALIGGAQICIIPDKIRSDTEKIAEFFGKNSITHCFLTPMIYRQIAQNLSIGTLRFIAAYGEQPNLTSPHENSELYTIFGPAECTVGVICRRSDKSDCRTIGAPIDNTKLYVVDRFMRPLPIGAEGELCIAGLQVGTGYINHPEQTAKKFIKNPFSNEQGCETLCRTGKIARRLDDGKVELIDRENQFTACGTIVDFHEIECIISEYPTVKDVFVTAFDASESDKLITAYIVSDETVDVEKLNQFIAECHPPYMIPARTIQVKRIPLNKNGYVDKKALAMPDFKSKDYIAPSTELESKIFEIVADILNNREYGVNTNLFSVGLSLTGASKLSLAIHRELNTAVCVSDIMHCLSVKNIAEFTENVRSSEKSDKHENDALPENTDLADNISEKSENNSESDVLSKTDDDEKSVKGKGAKKSKKRFSFFRRKAKNDELPESDANEDNIAEETEVTEPVENEGDVAEETEVEEPVENEGNITEESEVAEPVEDEDNIAKEPEVTEPTANEDSILTETEADATDEGEGDIATETEVDSEIDDEQPDIADLLKQSISTLENQVKEVLQEDLTDEPENNSDDNGKEMPNHALHFSRHSFRDLLVGTPTVSNAEPVEDESNIAEETEIAEPVEDEDNIAEETDIAEPVENEDNIAEETKVAEPVEDEDSIAEEPAVAEPVEDEGDITEEPEVAEPVENEGNITEETEVTEPVENEGNITEETAVAEPVENEDNIAEETEIAEPVENEGNIAEETEIAEPVEDEGNIAEETEIAEPVEDEGNIAEKVGDSITECLQHNTVDYAQEINSGEIGNVLLTGVTGFLGIHILQALLERPDTKIYCLLRKDKMPTVERRLKTLLVYYFNSSFDEMFGSRIFAIEGDITNVEQVNSLEEIPFDTLINCAACVKHFSDDDSLDEINVQGVKNLITLCEKAKRRLIQISTVGIAGENVNHKLPESRTLHENELYFGQELKNKHINSKFRAEKSILAEIKSGKLDAKIMRLGNLMSRTSDGEFQINYVTNALMLGLRGYAVIGKFPISHMDDTVEFSPVDYTAKAILQLAATDSRFTVFHPYNSHSVQMGDVISAMNECGIAVKPVNDDEFDQALNSALQDDEKAQKTSELIAYIKSDIGEIRNAVGCDNSFTNKSLYRLGFRWPITSEEYIKTAVQTLKDLGFFDGGLS